ncbi:MAG TPA: DUF4384 domain-containing protein [Bryobacteraceae bacterium]|jgi:hypothetical protein
MKFLPLVLVASIAAMAADSDQLAARRLYYQDNSPEVVFQATTVAKKPVPVKLPAASTSRAQQIEKVQQALRTSAVSAFTLRPVANLGVRYNVLKVDVATKTRTEVSPDTVFHEKDCVAVRIQPNRGGFLYVFNEGSSGKWHTLIPSAESVNDASFVNAYGLLEVPDVDCFQMYDRPGIERLLIVVTDKPEDVLKLNEGLKNPDQEIASSGLLKQRDLRITHVGSKPAAGEAPFSTYLVNAAATTADRLVLDIKLRHEK